MKLDRLRGPGPVLRIRVERRAGRWKVVKRIHLPEKVVPASEDLPASDKAGRWSGFWFEAVDAKGNVLYRQVLRPPPRGVEVFEEDGSIRRVPRKTDEYSLDLLIPDLKEIESVRLFLEEPEELAEKERAVRGRPLEPVALFPARESRSTKPTKKGGKRHGNR
jgi:hypothetical protein